MTTLLRTSLLCTLICSGIPASARAQGAFQNLDFEQANPVAIVGSPYYPTAVTSASALPDWTVYLGNVQSGQALYNNEFLGSATVDIVSSKFGGVIDGQFTAVLQSGTDTTEGGPLVSASIAQNGTIPTNAQSLQYKAAEGSQLLSVSFAGNTLTPFVIGSGQVNPSDIAYTLYGIDT